MATDSAIEWTKHTFNPWRGCEKVSPGCAHCYAETLSKRNPKVLGTWGKDGTRAIAAESYWRLPLAWNRSAKKAGERARVFCASLADVCEDRPDLVEPRRRLMMLIADTPHLDWLLLTKRPENIARLFDWSVLGCFDADEALPNVWWGTTCEDQQRADERIPHLLAVPAAVRFLSVEPMIGPVSLRPWLRYDVCEEDPVSSRNGTWERRIDWVIVGGESGPGARRFNPAWAYGIIDQCREACVACFVKQMGSNVENGEVSIDGGRRQWTAIFLRPRDAKGGDPAEWPEDLRVREFPRTADHGKEA